MKHLSILVLGAASLTAAQPSSVSGLMLYAVGGTGGLGGGLGYHFNEIITLRGELATFTYDDSFDQDGITYRGDLKLATQALYLDVHPFGGTFRLTVGVDNGRTRFGGTAVADGSGEVDVNGTLYPLPAGESITAEVRYPSTMPYLGIGWGLAGSGLNVGLDLGVNIGTADLVMTRSENLGLIPGFDADFEAQRALYANDVADIKVFPIIKLSVGYSF